MRRPDYRIGDDLIPPRHFEDKFCRQFSDIQPVSAMERWCNSQHGAELFDIHSCRLLVMPQSHSHERVSENEDRHHVRHSDR